MAAELIVGGVVGAVCGEILSLIIEETKITHMFKPELKGLESTLRSVLTIFEEIKQFNRELDRPEQETQELTEKLKEGKELLLQCSTKKVKWWNLLKRNSYSKKFIHLNTSIRDFFQLDMQLQQARDIKEILVIAKEKNVHGNNNKLIKSSVPAPPVNTLGLDVPLNELKMDLLKKKNGVQVIVVSAVGGSGKTTLVKKICQDSDVKGKFQDNIFFVTVSKKHDVKVIVQKIFQHKRYDLPKFETDEDAINHLQVLMKDIGPNPILLVLDDVWDGSESLLRDLSEFDLLDCKVLVTSRYAFPEFGPTHSLEPLNYQAAMELFRHSAIPKDGDSYIPDDDLVNKILRACKGSPLALTVVGKSLRGAPQAVWQKIVKEWDQGVSIFRSKSNADLLNCLHRSLVVLDNEVKECYMDLGSFPEGRRVPITALIDMWCELYKPYIEDGLDAITNLHELENRNLLNLVIPRKNASVDGFYNEHFVMLHDLLRELSIYQSTLESIEQTKRLIIDINGNNFPKWWLEKQQHLVNARLLSISTDESFSSSWYDMKAPAVEVVVLNIMSMKYTLPNFMETMDKLRVLIVTNYGFFPAELSNLALLGSFSNLKRIRLEHVSIPSSGMTMVPMMNLQKISLVMCNVGEAFKNSTLKISDAFPNLSELEIDYCNDMVELPDGLCDIVCMKKLSISNCHKLSKLPEDMGQLVNLELLRLVSCTELSALPTTIGNLSNLNFLDISDCLSMEELHFQIGELYGLKTLCIKGCPSFQQPSSIFELENLSVVKCDEEMAYELEHFRPERVKIEVVKDDINLNWLRNPGHF